MYCENIQCGRLTITKNTHTYSGTNYSGELTITEYTKVLQMTIRTKQQNIVLSSVPSCITFNFNHLRKDFLQMRDVPPALCYIHCIPEAKYTFNKLFLCCWFHLAADELLEDKKTNTVADGLSIMYVSMSLKGLPGPNYILACQS